MGRWGNHRQQSQQSALKISKSSASERKEFLRSLKDVVTCTSEHVMSDNTEWAHDSMAIPLLWCLTRCTTKSSLDHNYWAMLTDDHCRGYLDLGDQQSFKLP